MGSGTGFSLRADSRSRGRFVSFWSVSECAEVSSIFSFRKLRTSASERAVTRRPSVTLPAALHAGPAGASHLTDVRALIPR